MDMHMNGLQPHSGATQFVSIRTVLPALTVMLGVNGPLWYPESKSINKCALWYDLWGKVMFLHLSVVLRSVHGESLYDVTSSLPTWSHVPSRGVSVRRLPRNQKSERYTSYWNAVLLPPANEVCEGYGLTPVCHSVHGGRGGLPHCMLGYTPRAGTPPAQCMLGYGQQAGVTHPTGIPHVLSVI